MATATDLGDMTVEEAATESAGNWRDFDCFVWWREKDVPDSDKWAIFYTHHRDSSLIDQSNAAVINRTMMPFTKGDDVTVVPESHNHWAVGYIDGFSIRVFKRGRITKAFKAYYELQRRLDDYPLLDETDYSERELEATLENLPLAAWKLKNDYELPEGWEGDVYSWLSEHRWTAIENVDDQGGWPSEEELIEAFDALGYARLELA